MSVWLALEEGERVAVFSHGRQNPSDRGDAVVDIFRFENDRMVELWDVGQALPESSQALPESSREFTHVMR
jgi:predicted SnoaL-like aldol condensation-catalyzing enzyme